MSTFFEQIQNIFSYDPEHPLIFTQLFFWGFFAVALALYSFLYKKQALRTVFLLAVSFFFYYKTSGIFLILLIFTIISDFIWGHLIYKSRSDIQKRIFLTISVILNITLLCYFKYAYFFTESINQFTGTDITFFNHFSHFTNTWFGTEFSVDKLILPIGISFFTFQSLSYTIDMYRGKITPVKNILDYGFFVCFFPHLVAGPIVKAHDFLYQIYQPYKLSKTEFGLALFWILNGLAKKFMADYIGINYVDRIFENPGFYSGVEVVLGIFGYSLQIYADFSGYTDIAIGIALLLGFRLKTNFNSPYKATSTSDFWRRWHISLSSWLKEYLYIPLGGNRKGTIGSYISILILCFFLVLLTGKIWLIYLLIGTAILLLILARFFPKFKHSVNTNINILVTMLLGGLWHGSSWMFIIWGGLNGLGLMVHKGWERISPFKSNNTIAYRAFAIFLTLVFISFTRIWFRSDSLETVGVIFDRISYHFGGELFFKIISGYWFVLLVILLGYIIHWIPESIKINYRNWFSNLSYPKMIFTTVLIVFIIYQLVSSEMQPFIYFQF
ncbi:MAG: MBOAT family protein [Chitinophagales bacterium]|nr:MBOAT family protein [Chitinophagales bacterium]MBP9221466.1 MBOAT family protein [Chitinophagales bacterium]